MRALALSAALVIATTASGWAQAVPDHGSHDQTQAPPAPPHVHAPPPAEPAPPAESHDHSAMDHGEMGHGGHPAIEEVESDAAPSPPLDHAADQVFDPDAMQAARDQLRREHGGSLTSKIMLTLGEYQSRDGEDGYRWEGEARFGGDIHRLVLKTEGEGGADSGIDAVEVQALYTRAVTPYFDLQAGVRQDFEPAPRRTYATLGFQGVAPYWFDMQGALFLSDRGELLGRLEGAHDLRLTQRVVLQSRAELNLAAQDAPEIGIGAGMVDLELGLRLRYEVRRNFAPYVGVTYDRKFADTAEFARSAGEDPSRTSIVLGLRGWY